MRAYYLTSMFLGILLLVMPGGQARTAPDDGAELVGTVRDADGAPVENVRVDVRCRERDATARTDAAGNFSLADMPPGACAIIATQGARSGAAAIVLAPNGVGIVRVEF